MQMRTLVVGEQTPESLDPLRMYITSLQRPPVAEIVEELLQEDCESHVSIIIR